ncbi:hypothetical protein D3C85_1186430 [compost metagenome]
MHVFYGESLFIAVAFWAYLNALQQKWWRVGVLLAVLTATRLPSLLFVALCALEYLRAYEWNIKKAANKNILWFLLAPIGFIAYGLYLTIVRGDFFAMFHAYSTTDDWAYQIFNPNIFATLSETVLKIGSSLATRQFNYEIFVNYALPLAAITAIAGSSLYLLLKLKSEGVPLFVFGIFAIILFTLNSNVISVHRYALACIVLYIAVGLINKTGNLRILLSGGILCSLSIQVFLYSRFIQTVFAG